jgi:transcriptional regulator with XRE-family HTH domain
MFSLKKLLAYNMRKRRRDLGLSQSQLAERVETSAHYIAMIERERKTPSIPMIENIARALEVQSAELFSMQSVPLDVLNKLKADVLSDMEKAILAVIASHAKTLAEPQGI